MNKERLIAFTDAIVAIAATIMVLELAVPLAGDWAGLVEELPTFGAYIVSFFMIYITWIYHHNLFQVADRITMRAYLLNGLWVFFLTLVPFLTAWVGRNPDAFPAEFLYTLDMVFWSISFALLDRQMTKDNPECKEERARYTRERMVMFGVYLVILVLTWFYPRVGLYGIAALALFLFTRTAIIHVQKDKATQA